MGDLGEWVNYSSYDESGESELSEDFASVANSDAVEALEHLFDGLFDSSSSSSSSATGESQNLLEFLTESYDIPNYNPYSGEAIDRDRISRDVNYVREVTRRLGEDFRRQEGVPGTSPRLRGIVENILRDVPPIGQGGITTILKVAATLCFAATNFPHVIVAESLSFIFTTFAGPKLQFALSLALLALKQNEGKNNAIAAATLRVKSLLRTPLGAGRPGSSSSIRGGTVGMYQSVGDQIFKVLQFLTTLAEKGPGFAVDFDCFNCQENGDVGVLYGYPRWES